MAHDTAAATRQLHLVELDADGQQRGPTTRWPQDWPSAAATIDLSAATLEQAVEAWRAWVTGADDQLLVDVALSVSGEMLVLIGGRAWRASIPKPGLNATALEYLRRQEIEPEAYIAHWCGDTWTGDTCGCVDDRCIGYHHDATDECHCFPVWVEDFMANVPVRQWGAAVTPAEQDAQVAQIESPALPGQRPARPGELCSCGRPAVIVYETERFGDVPGCGIPDGGMT